MTHGIEKQKKVANLSHKPALKKLAVGYARVSTPSQGKNGISLEIQKDSIERFANHAGYSLIETFDEVGSGVGAKSLLARPVLRRALDIAVREGADLLVWDWDRLSRYAKFREQLAKQFPIGVQIICVKEGTILREASSHAVLKQGELTAAEISRRTKAGMHKKRAEGAVFGNPNIKTTVQPKGAAARLKASESLVWEIAEILRSLPDPFSPTYAEIAEILNNKGLRTLHRGEWTKSRVRKPVTRARDVLREERVIPNASGIRFGMF